MCGIAGYVDLGGRDADRSVLAAMCDVILHRGPDSDGMLVEGPVALGMRRLRIIDVEGGDQPIDGREGRTTIVYNGECYDFLEHRRDLEARGHRFRTRSDTETIVRLYDEYGIDGALDRLRGMYAFAIWDRTHDRLVIARDRIGKKPLYYYDDGELFAFGSEIKSILIALARRGRPRPALCREALVQYMGYGYVPDPLSIFTGIRKLPPAHRLVLENGRLDVQRYWALPEDVVEGRSDEDMLEEMEATLEEAVRLRLISDVPLGAYLSGGIDSSTVVGLMSRCSDSPVKTFSIGFEDADFDELPHARQVARHLGTDHHELVVKPDAAAVIGDIVRHFDEPFADSSAIPTYYVSKMAREHVTVVLSGDGGDELFAGYARYRAASRGGLWARLPLPLRSLLFGGAARCLPTGFFGKSMLTSLSLGEDERYVHAITSGVSEWHRSLYTEGFADSVATTDPSSVYLDRLRSFSTRDAMTRRMFADIHLYLPADIMTKVDRMSMMVSLEARAPLLDHRFVELAARLPLRAKVRDGTTKYLLRRLAKRLVPAEVIDRKKHGFAVPVSRWFNAEWLERADDLLVGARARERGIFRPETVARLLSEHRRGRRDRSFVLWSLMGLELWFRSYVDENLHGS